MRANQSDREPVPGFARQHLLPADDNDCLDELPLF